MNLRIMVLEEEMKYIREHLINKDSNVYHQLLAKYNEPEIKVKTDKEIEIDGHKYIVDSSQFVWDLDGYRVGEIKEGVLNYNI